MRLIDADRLLNPGYTDMWDEPIKFDTFSRYAIESQPTVEAIPIEWIRQWSEQFYKDINGRVYYTGDGYDTIWDMLKDWEKENETI